jgi:hypothetical protein
VGWGNKICSKFYSKLYRSFYSTFYSALYSKLNSVSRSITSFRACGGSGGDLKVDGAAHVHVEHLRARD